MPETNHRRNSEVNKKMQSELIEPRSRIFYEPAQDQLQSPDKGLAAWFEKNRATFILVVCEPLVRRFKLPLEPDDLAQQVYMKAARQNALKNFDPTKEWKAWLSTIARRVALDEARKLREIPIIITEEHHEATPDRDTPEQQLHLKRETTRLMNALEDLPDEQRRALEASYGSDQSNSEAAAELNIPIGTLKSRISSAKRALGDRMDV